MLLNSQKPYLAKGTYLCDLGSSPPIVCLGSSASCSCHPQVQLHLLPCGGLTSTTDKDLAKHCRAQHAGAQPSLPAVSVLRRQAPPKLPSPLPALASFRWQLQQVNLPAQVLIPHSNTLPQTLTHTSNYHLHFCTDIIIPLTHTCNPSHACTNTYGQMQILTLSLTHLFHTYITLSPTHASHMVLYYPHSHTCTLCLTHVVTLLC